MKLSGQTVRTTERAEGQGPRHSRHVSKTSSLIERIMAPVDFSPTSLRALNYAFSIAETAGAMVHVVHVIEPVPFLSGLETSPLVISDPEAAAQCEHELAKIASKFSTPSLQISSDVHMGRAATEICRIAKETHSDLLVVSTHGRTGLKHLLMGSVAERIVREASCPVLVVRERELRQDRFNGDGTTQIRKILVPTDFSQSSLAALRYAVEFAGLVGAEITLLHCIMPPIMFTTPQTMTIDTAAITESLRYAANQTITDIAHENLHRDVDGGFDVVVGPPLAEIPEFATLGRFDLIICATHGYTGLKHALLGSTAEGLVRYSPCPVLVFRGHSHRKPKAGRLARRTRGE